MIKISTRLFLLFLLFGTQAGAQGLTDIINQEEVTRLEEILAADSLAGRKIFTAGIQKAADLISGEFKEAGLKEWPGAQNYRQMFEIKVANSLKTEKAENIVGFLPGKNKPDEYVIFSAHYDHLGTDGSLKGDTIYNGANDDASGTTAVIELAKYFSKKADNERSLIFVTFTGEEEGGYGSRYFSEQLDPGKIVAMLNIEMIGTPSKWGESSAYITGYEKSTLGKILQNNLKGSGFRFYADPYPKQNLFYRSDNATLARLGVPAHTISTSKMDDEPNYHKVSDEISTLDLQNMTKIIRSIAISAKSIISGRDTPTRVRLGTMQKRPH